MRRAARLGRGRPDRRRAPRPRRRRRRSWRAPTRATRAHGARERPVDFGDQIVLALRCCASAPTCGRAYQRPLPLHPGRRVPGHQPRAVRAGEAARGAPPEPRGGRRRRPGNLPVPRRSDLERPRLRRARIPEAPRVVLHGELPLAPGDPRRRVPADPLQRSRPPGGRRIPRRRSSSWRRASRAGPSRSTCTSTPRRRRPTRSPR